MTAIANLDKDISAIESPDRVPIELLLRCS